MALNYRDDNLNNDFDRYDFCYPPDATERDLAEYDAAAEREELRRELEQEEYGY